MKEFSRIKKRCQRIIKKMFGYRTIAIALKQKEGLRQVIEAILDKPIEEVNFSDIKKNSLCAEYAEYCTLKSILDTYIDTVIIEKFQRS